MLARLDRFVIGLRPQKLDNLRNGNLLQAATARCCQLAEQRTAPIPHHRQQSSQAQPIVQDEGASALTFPFERLEHAVSSATAAALERRGWAVVDGLLGEIWCNRLRQEILALKEGGLMHLNCTHLVRNGERQLLEKANIHEADLLLEEVRRSAPLFSSLCHDATIRTMLSLMLPQLRLDSQAIKLQYNAGNGACFPIHADSDEAVDGRRVSAIFYLNPSWQPSHGGQLRLYPFPHSHVDIEPVNDRLVLFSSCRVPHRVLQSQGERICFTIWLSQSRGIGFGQAGGLPRPLPEVLHSWARRQEGGGGSNSALELLQEPEVRKAVTKLAYVEEWAMSIHESHPDSEARATTLAQFWKEVEVLRREVLRVAPEMQEVILGGKARDAAQQLEYSWF